MKEIVEAVRAFVEENFLYAKPDFQLHENDSLLGKGIVDSMGIMEVLEFLESRFGISVPADDITEANLGSLSSIAAYVARFSGAASSTAS
ncbi:MAG TPA: acyl carrier protein [Longimicrobiales bacterium]|nr:acyl carrier protein [Longimicrobiales bacterium]